MPRLQAIGVYDPWLARGLEPTPEEIAAAAEAQDALDAEEARRWTQHMLANPARKSKRMKG